MEEKKFVGFKKEELEVKDYIKRSLGKGKISSVLIEYTPVGEKIVVATSKPGLVIGRKGEKIDELTSFLKNNFSLDNPHIEIKDVPNPMLDAQLVADDIALDLERRGSLKFKVIAYRTLRNVRSAGALGVEIVLSGKLPSDRSRTWRFTEGYLKKTGEPSKVVDRAISQAITLMGVVGIKVSILKPDAEIHDRIVVDDEMMSKVRLNAAGETPDKKTAAKKADKKTAAKKADKNKESSKLNKVENNEKTKKKSTKETKEDK